MAELLVDGMFAAPSVAMATLHSSPACQSPPTYLFDFRSDTGIDVTRSPPTRRSRTTRDVLDYVFGAPLVDGLDPFDGLATNSRVADVERKLAKTVMTYLSNFFHTG